MQKLRMVAGPTRMPQQVRETYAEDIGSPDVELEEFFEDYFALETSLQKLLGVNSESGASIPIMSGEGMVVLWGAMKSVIVPNDIVLCVVNGVFGDVCFMI